jgi:glucose/arabinose dehydrogenase
VNKRMPLWVRGLALAVLVLALGPGLGKTAAQPPAVDIHVNRVVASGLGRPVQVTHAGDGSGRLFVVEQPGRIRIVKGGALLPVPFLDLTPLVALSSEQGLLGLAFHPQYPANGYFYVNYTRAGDGATVIARYSVSASNPDAADPASALEILIVPQPATNHNGGQIAFGPHDGYLYVGMGDGGGSGDPLDNAQNINTLLGALLRLDVDGGLPYAIPADNPFAAAPGADEIWAFGLRNPWRFSFDRATGDLYLGDVGQNLWEEIDYQASGTPGGVNFGWNCREGTHDYDFTGDCLTATLTDPIAEYDHTEGQAVTGGFVYRGIAYPALRGRYFYGDYAQGKIWSLVKTGSNPDTWSTPELELDTTLQISAFGEDEAGELYVVDLAGGTVRRIVDANAPAWFVWLPLVASHAR